MIRKGLLLFIFFSTTAYSLQLTNEQAETFADLIWMNECKGSIDGLTSWNAGEEFASIGIGHFLWYPEGKEGPFEDQFPAFVSFAHERGFPVPEWLLHTRNCPWRTRQEFCENINNTRMVELRQFLANSTALQARFIAFRLDQCLPRISEAVQPAKRDHVIKMFNELASQPQGLYVLLDYLNFKGEGTSLSERYNQCGWGLAQVLEEMPEASNDTIIKEFVTTAKHILVRRVVHSPPARNEKKWLQGWYNRLDTYQIVGTL